MTTIIDQLKSVSDALDQALGDSDPMIDPNMTDNEIKAEYPVLWACSKINKLISELTKKGEQRGKK